MQHGGRVSVGARPNLLTSMKVRNLVGSSFTDNLKAFPDAVPKYGRYRLYLVLSSQLMPCKLVSVVMIHLLLVNVKRSQYERSEPGSASSASKLWSSGRGFHVHQGHILIQWDKVRTANSYRLALVVNILRWNIYHWRIQGGRQGRAPPWGSKFFHFHAVFGKKLKNNSTFGSWRPPPPGENPGSATVYTLIHARLDGVSVQAKVIAKPSFHGINIYLF